MNQKNAPWLLLLTSAMWGSSFVASKICMNGGMRQFETVFFRFGLATLLTFVLFYRQLRRPHRRAVRTGIIVGLITVCSYTLEMFGITMTQASKASFLTATNIVMMPFLYFLFCHVKPRLGSVGAAVLAFTGVGFLSLTDGFGSFALGDALLLSDALTYGLNSIAVAMLAGEESRVEISFYQFLTTTAVMGVLSLFQGFSAGYTAPAVAALVYQAGLPTVACYILKNMAIRYMGPVRCTMILSTESIFCAIVSRVLLHEVLTPRMLLGAALILTGVLMEVLLPVLRQRHAVPAHQG
ncbi:DMT family transporter [Dysosmobacter sp.]|uniref:DMT family transporter n=1 Tax=Dysosmobacter sp. TaxID=2591382 RepID=UPI002A8FA32D|nr:DMT family transporter [Dysosmobacter sp.]MDY3281737.1 DMT family transporter [Dysosmobacter sp.]